MRTQGNMQADANKPGLTDLAYNLVTILENKAKATRAYEQYIQDAKKANSPDCAALMQRIQQDDLRHIDELKQHVSVVLEGRTMGGH